MTILVVSPHLDDAILSVGAWLSWHPGAHIVTVFAGDPDVDRPLAGWDRACGFANGVHAMRVRRHEDSRACKALGATYQHLPLVDGQYRDEIPYPDVVLSESLATIADALAPELVLAPLGIVHSDHRAVGAACRGLARAGRQLVLYEEIPYRVDDPISAVREVTAAGVQWYCPDQCPDDVAAAQTKARAVACYTSQLWAIPRWALYIPERLWLTPGVDTVNG